MIWGDFVRLILWFIVIGAFVMCTQTWGGNINAPLIPTVRDRLYTISYNETELRYDPELSKRIPYPKNQQQVIELYHRALKTNNEDDNYVLFSFFRISCTDFNHLHDAKSAKEECVLANYFLKRVLEINPNNGLALLFTGVNYQHGNRGSEKICQKRLHITNELTTFTAIRLLWQGKISRQSIYMGLAGSLRILIKLSTT